MVHSGVIDRFLLVIYAVCLELDFDIIYAFLVLFLGPKLLSMCSRKVIPKEASFLMTKIVHLQGVPCSEQQQRGKGDAGVKHRRV